MMGSKNFFLKTSLNIYGLVSFDWTTPDYMHSVIHVHIFSFSWLLADEQHNNLFILFALCLYFFIKLLGGGGGGGGGYKV